MPLPTKDLDRLRELRHWLHAHPELSRQEVETARYLRGVLMQEAVPDRIVDLHGAGFAAVYDGKAPGLTVMLRCELDALPIAETNTDLPHRSTTDGIGHKCGHDGHMAMLVGVGFALARQRPAAGRVVLVFQPDEETGTGAAGCVGHPSFELIRPDLVFALHNLPGFAFGEIVSRPGVFASAVYYEAIHFAGRPAHSAQPATGASPAMAIAELVLSAEAIASAARAPGGYALAVPIFTRMGVASSGVAPAHGEVHFTLRSDSDAVVEAMRDHLARKAGALADRHGLSLTFETLEKYRSSTNGGRAVSLIEAAARACGKTCTLVPEPFRWGEDFGAFTAIAEGAMFGLGAGTDMPTLHDQAYDFPDALLPEGIGMFLALLERNCQ